MSRTISTHLEARYDRLTHQGRSAGMSISLLAHIALVATAWIASTWTPAAGETIDFTPVRLVPVAALGSRTAPVQPQPTQPEPSPVETPVEEPEPQESSAEDAAPERDAPVFDGRSRPDRATETTPPRPRTRSPQPQTQRRGSPTGSRLGTAAAGSSTASLDSPDFTYSYYTDQLLSQIDSYWNRPVIGGDIEAVVHFVINKDGSLAESRLVTSSGYNSFDLAALRAIRAASPFPPLPASFRHATLGVNLTVR